MVLFTVSIIALIIVAMITTLVIAIGGGAFIIAFSDVIVCGVLLYWILKHFYSKHKNK